MRIDSLQLIGFIRLALNNIHDITLTPNELYQFILGTNGSGKSRLINELSPLPGDKDDFKKGGSKIIKITHNNRKYCLTNKFDQKNHHSFIVIANGVEEELNPGGTITIQRDLVKQEFKLTEEIHQLIIGNEKFHSMSAARRREWFTMLCPVDYSYAFGLYNHFRTRLRDTTGALRNAKKELVEAVSKVLSDDDTETLRNEIKLVGNELTILMRESTVMERSYNTLEREQGELAGLLQQLSSKLLRMRLMAPYGTTVYGVGFDSPIARDEAGIPLVSAITCIDDVTKVLHFLSHQQTSLVTSIEHNSKLLRQYEEHYRIIQQTGEEGVKPLEQKMATLQAQVNDLSSKKKLKLQYTDVRTAYTMLKNLEESLYQLFSAMSENIDDYYTSVKLNTLSNKVEHNAYHRLGLVNKITSKNSSLANAKVLLEKNAVICPNCKHSWHLDNIQSVIDKCNKEIDLLTTELHKHEIICEKDNEKLVDMSAYASLYRGYVTIVRQSNALEPLWVYLDEAKLIKTSPTIIPNLISKALADMELDITIIDIQNSITQTTKLIEAANLVGDEKLTDVKESIEKTRSIIDQLTHKQYTVNSDIQQYTKYGKQLGDANTLAEHISKMTNDLTNVTNDLVNSLRQKTIDHCINQLQSSLAMKQTSLDKAMHLKNNVTRLEESIARLTKDEEYGAVILQVMSPSDGLIAMGLMGFVKKFTKQMNTLIRRIWSYPLIIKDCGTADTNTIELDYRFPLMVQTKNNVVPDVKMGSTAMREIVDLAFLVEAMHCLGISDFPLYLDELGHSFDQAHRESVANAIKLIMETQSFTQLFMISHYSSVYGTFTNAEFCVLDPRNITVPSKYNEHVTIIKDI